MNSDVSERCFIGEFLWRRNILQVQGTRYEKVGTGRSFVDMCEKAAESSAAHVKCSKT